MNIFGLDIKRAAKPQEQKASPKELVNVVNKMLNEYKIFNGVPIWQPDDLETYINKGFLYNGLVYSIITRILNQSRGVPFFTYEMKDKKKAAKYLEQKALKNFDAVLSLKEQAFEPVLIEGLDKLLKNPNSNQDEVQFKDNFRGFYLLLGNSYIYKILAENGLDKGTPLEMHIMPAHNVEIIGGNFQDPIKGYTLKGFQFNNELVIPRENIVHMRTWSPDYSGAGSHLYGVSPMRAGNRLLQSNNDSYTALVSLFQNMGAKGILTGKDGQYAAFTQEQAIEVQRVWQEIHGSGPEAAGKMAIIGGEANWVQMGMNAIDLSILDSQKMSLRDLCMLWGMPSELFGDPEAKSYNNQKEATKAAINNAIIPLLEAEKSAFQKGIVDLYSKKLGKQLYYDFDISVFEELKGDFAAIASANAASWWVTPNEKRVREYLPPLAYSGMDAIFIPQGYLPIEDAAEPPIMVEPTQNTGNKSLFDAYNEKEY